MNAPPPKQSSRTALQAGVLRGFGLATFTAVAWQLVACGGAEPRASVAGGEPPTTLEAAEAELSRLEASLDLTFGAVTPESGAGSGAGSAADPLPAPPPADVAEPGKLSKKGESASRCENACDALASMSRSADRICQLAGPGDRCEAAKSRVASASARVVAQCSECES